MLRNVQFALAFLLVSLSVAAQVRMGGPRSSLSARSSHMMSHAHRPFYPPAAYYGLPYFYSDFYAPNDVEYVPQEPPPAPAAVVQPTSEPVADPLLLELHGNQWVKVTNFGEASGRVLATAATQQEVPKKPLPPAILVFRDGHTEEVTSYSIIGESIHIKSDYWTAGAWNRTVPIATLDLPATQKQNQARGVSFELPSSPDEVMIRP